MIDSNVDQVVAALTGAGVGIRRIVPAEQNADAGIEIRDGLSVAVGADGAHITIDDSDGFHLGPTRAMSDMDALIADIRGAR